MTTIRDQFEQWADPAPNYGMDLRQTPSGEYHYRRPREAWEIWQAVWKAQRDLAKQDLLELRDTLMFLQPPDRELDIRIQLGIAAIDRMLGDKTANPK